MKDLSPIFIKLCFVILILFGIYKLYPYFYVFIKALQGQVSINMSSPNVREDLFFMGLLSLTSLVLGALLIVSGIGIYYFKNWARILSLILLSLELVVRLMHLFIVVPSKFEISSNIEMIIVLSLCFVVIALLSLKSVKATFK